MWSKEMPTKPGKYRARCAETKYAQYEVIVYVRDGFLYAKDADFDIGLSHYHNSLIDLEWLPC